MKKKIFIISLLFCLLSVLTFANNCFQYIELSKGTKKAIEHYGEHYGNATMLYLMYQRDNTDSIVFTLIDSYVPVVGFMRSPTMYFSLHNDKLILIYNGEENNYNPDATDMNNIIYFLSHFDKSITVVKSDWEKKELTRARRRDTARLYSSQLVQYYVDNESIICNQQITDESLQGYPEIRYDVKTIFVE